jgi:hypothetical protein
MSDIHSPNRYQRIRVWICTQCDDIHISAFTEDDRLLAQVMIHPQDVGAVIKALSEIQDDGVARQ